MYYPRFTKVIIHHFLIQDKTLSWRNKIGMHTSKDDYLINSLRFVFAKESTQIYGAILPECLTSPVMKESKAYKTYLGYATDEEPIQKGKRVKRPAKKSTTKPAAGVVIKEAHVETKSKSKEKEKVDVSRGKGIELLSEVALTEEAQMKEVRKKSLRDFYKTHIVVLDSTESESESWGNDEDDSNNEQESSNEGSEQENESEEQESDSEQEEESEDDDQEEEEFVHTPTNDKDDDNLESESDDVIKSDEEKGMDDTTYQFDDDVDARLKEPTQTDKEVVQGEGADAEMNDAQQGNENLETTQEQVIEDAYVTISTIMKKIEVPVTSSSHSSDLVSKFLKFSNIPHADAEIVSKLDVHVYPMKSQDAVTHRSYNTVFRFNDRITSLEKEVTELKKDPLHTQVITLVDEHLDTRLGETKEEFMKFLLESLTTRIKEQVKDQPPQILPKEVSNFASHVIKKLIKESRDEVTLAKVSYQPHSTYETASTLAEFELKMILIGHNEKTWPEKIWIKMKSLAGSGRGLKKRKTSKCRTTTEPTDPDWHEGKTPQKGPTQKWLTTLAASTSTDKSNLTKEIPVRTAFKLLKGTRTNYAELEYDFEECYKALSEKLDWENPEGGDYPFDLSKPLLEQRKSLYAYARGMQSRGDVYSTKRILAVTHVKINDIEDMLLLVVQNRLTNLLGDDVADFAIALRMFTRSLASFFARRHYQEYRHGVLAKEKMEHIGKEKSSFHDQGHQQAAKGKDDDEEFGEICWRIMSSITAQQTKLDLELVLKEKRLGIKKCNGRLNPRKIQREPTFQVVLDDLALTPCYSAFLITTDAPGVHMHQF
ncbi:hypothetical protein Tco_0308465 [Tanacetum coccineum]